MIWLVFAVLSAAVVLGLVWPLARQAKAGEPAAPDVAFYRSQLAELGADVARGVVPAAEAEATRTEIARRLLAAARRPGTEAAGPVARLPRLVAAVVAVLLVPGLALPLYLHLGRPLAPDEPLSARLANGGAFDLAAAIPRIESHLATHPDDGRGFALIAPLYMRLGRFADAATAYRAALRTGGETAERRAALGQALMMAADGVVTAEARAAFERALDDDPRSAEARFFLAIAAEQDGDRPRALALWRALAADSPAEAPWRAAMDSHIAGLIGAAPPAAAGGPGAPPGGEAGAAIAALPAAERRDAIAGMVAGLAARLAQNGRDASGWLRLIRAYTVLGDSGKARTSLGEARHALQGDAPAQAALDALGRELGLEG